MLRVAFLMVCGVILASQCIDAGKDRLAYRQAEKEYESWIDDTKEKDDGTRVINFENLQKINPDLVAWIQIPDTTIDYPVVQGRDNDYYLNHTAAGKENHSGAIFLDAGCDHRFSYGNYILYGHNLRTGKMFGVLKVLYASDDQRDPSRQAPPDIFIRTPKEEIVYHVFSVRKVHLNRQRGVYALNFADEQAWKDYVTEAAARSLLPWKEPPTRETSLLTLSTCTSDSDDGRLVVQAYETGRRPVGEKR